MIESKISEKRNRDGMGKHKIKRTESSKRSEKVTGKQYQSNGGKKENLRKSKNDEVICSEIE